MKRLLLLLIAGVMAAALSGCAIGTASNEDYPNTLAGGLSVFRHTDEPGQIPVSRLRSIEGMNEIIGECVKVIDKYLDNKITAEQAYDSLEPYVTALRDGGYDSGDAYKLITDAFVEFGGAKLHVLAETDSADTIVSIRDSLAELSK